MIRKKVKLKQRCAFTNLNHELAVPALWILCQKCSFGGHCFPWAGLAKATENVWCSTCLGPLPSGGIPGMVWFHCQGHGSGNGVYISQALDCVTSMASVLPRASACWGWDVSVTAASFHPLPSIQPFPSSFFPLTLVPCTWLLTRSLLLSALE